MISPGLGLVGGKTLRGGCCWSLLVGAACCGGKGGKALGGPLPPLLLLPPSVERTTVSGKGAGCWKRGGREDTAGCGCLLFEGSGEEEMTAGGGGGIEAVTGSAARTGNNSRGGDEGVSWVTGGKRWGGVGAETG